MQLSIKQIHEAFLKDPQFKEIQHVPTELYKFETPMRVMEDCLIIPFSTFQRIYAECIGILKQQDPLLEQIAADIVLCLNGQNQKAWNCKRRHWQELNVQKQLKLNEAVCMKFKKSAIVYDFRLNLIKRSKKSVREILQKESQFIFNILKRFHRNYYCWTYRLKLFTYFLDISSQKDQLVELERNLIKQYCGRNIHEYSGFWYLYNLMNRRGLGYWREQQLGWVNQLIEIFEKMYSKDQDGARLYSLKKYKDWICSQKTQ